MGMQDQQRFYHAQNLKEFCTISSTGYSELSACEICELMPEADLD